MIFCRSSVTLKKEFASLLRFVRRQIAARSADVSGNIQLMIVWAGAGSRENVRKVFWFLCLNEKPVSSGKLSIEKLSCDCQRTADIARATHHSEW